MNRIAVSLGMLTLVSHSLVYAGRGFEVKGVLSAESESFPKSDFRFSVRVAGGLWNIHAEPEGQAAVTFYEDAFDGAYVYYYEKLRLADGDRGVNTSLGIIESGKDVPSESSTLAPPLWLAFCSSQFFKTARANSMPGLFGSGYEKRPLGSKLTFARELHPAFPNLPKAVDLFSDGTAYSRVAGGTVEVSKFPAPFDKGFLEASFRALSFTNFAGFNIPQTFKLDIYLPRISGGSSKDVIRVMTWKGEVRSMSTETNALPASFTPLTDGKTLMEDRRFPPVGRHGVRVNYLNTNAMGRWTEAKTAAKVHTALTRNDQIIGRQTLHASPPKNKRYVFIAMALLWSIPLFICLRRILRRT